MPARDLRLLIDAARMAGRVATSFVGKTAQRWDKPGGAGPVTEADLAVNEMLASTLQLARPDYGWLSEESEDNAERLGKERVFIIDPDRRHPQLCRRFQHMGPFTGGGRSVA